MVGGEAGRNLGVDWVVGARVGWLESRLGVGVVWVVGRQERKGEVAESGGYC